jgi:hypothetical protein
MTAEPPQGEKVARAVPLPLFVGENMTIVVTPEIYSKIGEGDTVFLLSIALGLFYFSN